jgi:peptidoglycan/xylan/chitin deacetylase (PgdA/CDA1 family)
LGTGANKVKFVSPLLKRVVYPCLSGSGFLQRLVKDLCVITYHGVLPQGYERIDPMLDGGLVSADSFRRQLRLLRSHYNIVHPEQLLSAGEQDGFVSSRSVLVTCDDGLLNTLTDMLPILQEERIPCLLFVTGFSSAEESRMLWYEELYLMMLMTPDPNLLADFDPILVKMGSKKRGDLRSYWWGLVKKLSRLEREDRDRFLGDAREQLGLREDWDATFTNDPHRRRRFLLLDRSELKEMAESGLTIGSHTLSHPMLSQMQAEHAWKEVADSRRVLEEALQRPVWALAYPFGDPGSVTYREMEMANRAGYKWAFSNCEGGLQGSAYRFSIPRVHVTADMTLSEFEAHVSGFHETLRRRFVKPMAASVAAE